MEILQTIWTALTTENEVLTNIITSCIGFLEATITMLLFTSIFNIKSNNKTKCFYVLSFTIISIFTNYFIPNPYNSFVNVCICPILIILLFKTKRFTAILAELISYIIFFVTGAIVLNLFIVFFKIPTDELVKIPIFKSSLFLFNCLFAYVIYCILKHFNINITLLDTIKPKRNTILFINFFIGILAVCVQAYIASVYSDILPFGIFILNISTLLFYFIFSLYSLVRTNKLEITERDLEQSKQYINTLTILHDNIRCFKHDFGNMVTTIGRICSNKQSGRFKNLLFSIIRRLPKS